MAEAGWHALRPVELDFEAKAEQVFRMEEQVAAPLERVWEAFADAMTWSRRFPGVEWARYDVAGPAGVGTIRRSSLGGVQYEETMLVWDRPRRWACRVDRSAAPVARAQLEITDVERSGSGTRVRWTLAVEPPFDRFLANLFRDAMRGLEAYLA